jgi:hypothetical protein
MQVLIRCGRESDLIAHVEPLLDIALRDNIRPDGSILTWLLDVSDASERSKRQAAFVESMWGDDSDVEVNANLFCALARYDRMRFADVVERGQRFVCAREQPGGAWESTWYQGVLRDFCLRASACNAARA